MCLLQLVEAYMDTNKEISIPDDFPYREAFTRGRPVHEKFDIFSIKHPAMPLEKRAKIFSPFDALKGFNDAISSKEIIYEPRRVLSEEDMRMLDEKLSVLRKLTINGNAARTNRTYVEIEYFRLREDDDTSDEKGTYMTECGILMKVDDFTRTIIMDDGTKIPVDDIISISSPVFDTLCTD